MRSSGSSRGEAVPERGRSPLIPWLVGVAIVLLVAVVVIALLGREPDLPGERIASQGQEHLTSIDMPHADYNSTPPTSGPHAPNVARWGSYDYPLPDELLVHNIEDGGVVLWYPMGTIEQNGAYIERLEEVARPYEKIVIAPRDDLETTYALSAWQNLDKFDEFDADRISAFLEAFADGPHF